MDFLRIAGNEANLDRWIRYLSERRLITNEDASGKAFYVKTEIGSRLHSVLKDHEYLGPLFEELAKSRLGPPG